MMRSSPRILALSDAWLVDHRPDHDILVRPVFGNQVVVRCKARTRALAVLRRGATREELDRQLRAAGVRRPERLLGEPYLLRQLPDREVPALVRGSRTSRLVRAVRSA